MDINAVYREVGTFRATAEICGMALPRFDGRFVYAAWVAECLWLSS
jgi:hypothetical protein